MEAAHQFGLLVWGHLKKSEYVGMQYTRHDFMPDGHCWLAIVDTALHQIVPHLMMHITEWDMLCGKALSIPTRPTFSGCVLCCVIVRSFV